MFNFQRSKSSNPVYRCWKCTFGYCPIQLHYSFWWFSGSLPKPLRTLDRVYICPITWSCSICKEECCAGHFSSYIEWYDEGPYLVPSPLLTHTSSSSLPATILLLFRHFGRLLQVKGFINEMAVRIEDEDERISSLAKLFFHELSKKGMATCVRNIAWQTWVPDFDF